MKHLEIPKALEIMCFTMRNLSAKTLTAFCFEIYQPLQPVLHRAPICFSTNTMTILRLIFFEATSRKNKIKLTLISGTKKIKLTITFLNNVVICSTLSIFPKSFFYRETKSSRPKNLWPNSLCLNKTKAISQKYFYTAT